VIAIFTDLKLKSNKTLSSYRRVLFNCCVQNLSCFAVRFRFKKTSMPVLQKKSKFYMSRVFYFKERNPTNLTSNRMIQIYSFI
jgi:hypothetical protein